MKLSMDLTHEGLLMFFKPYQLNALKSLWASSQGMNTREVWEAIGSDKISRASVINFLAEAAENGLLEVSTTTGKGGHRGIYKPKYNEEGTKEFIKRVFKERMDGL
jgi:predicted transcriptional regulator